MNVHLCVLLLLIRVVSIQSLTCSCSCGGYTYYPGTTCSTSSSCASTCYSSYGSCSYYNTQGCCGTQACAYYSSSSYPSSYYYKQCNCQCSSWSSSTATLVGTASMSSCTTTNCQQACNSLYPTTCGVYNNQAYCTSSTTTSIPETYIFMLSMIIVFLIQNKNKNF